VKYDWKGRIMAIKIALAGNPNSGKTTLFNALTGSNRYVGNWPGVTVEKKEGRLKGEKDIILTDLPGIYSLSPYSPEELIARDYLLKERPDAIINIIDGTNIERNLYLTTQLTELSIPMVIAVNFIDIVRRKKDSIDLKKLAQVINCPVFEISALKGLGLQEVASAAIKAAGSEYQRPSIQRFSGAVEHALAHIEEAVLHSKPYREQRWSAIKLFERDLAVYEELEVSKELLNHIENDIRAVEEELGEDSDSIIINERYKFVTNAVKLCCLKNSLAREENSDRIDKVLMNRFAALPIFALLMFGVYYLAVTVAGTVFADFTSTLFRDWIGNGAAAFLESVNSPVWLKGLIADGIIGGVGSVLSFVPQIIVLFLLLSLLEECGYMSRIAFLIDKLFRKFGLSGKSFIPMLVSTGCGVSGILATRTIENEKERKITIMTTTFMPCGAKLPVVALISGAMFGNAGWVSASVYLIGIASVAISGIILKKTKGFSAKPSPFVMELPSYHLPDIKSVVQSTWSRSVSFIKKAGTIILISSIIIWAASNFGFIGRKPVLVENTEDSLLAMLGRAIAVLFVPLGFGNWKAAVAVIAGLAAKENIVATLGVLYGFASDGTGGAEILGTAFSQLSAYAFLLFNLLCAPCIAAMAAIFRELKNFREALWAIGYQTLYAYGVSLMVYQFGRLVQGTASFAGIAFAFALFAALIWWIFIKDEKIIKSDCNAGCDKCPHKINCR